MAKNVDINIANCIPTLSAHHVNNGDTVTFHSTDDKRYEVTGACLANIFKNFPGVIKIPAGGSSGALTVDDKFTYAITGYDADDNKVCDSPKNPPGIIID